MTYPQPPTSRWMILQLALLALTVCLLAGWPPRSGMLLLVPLGHAPAERTIDTALAAGAWLVAPGPLPRSYVVRGERDALIAPMLAAGILVLAAPAAGCGA
ncbi:hypothetical protein [Sphingomonas sp.]|uniref:hypothetical protein n=1 Tax=Sphingomonas sp. TaxID=28214 RepID=UPI0035BBA8ED